MKIVKERKLNEFYIQLKIVSVLLRKDSTFTSLWNIMNRYVGSKYTLKKYLDILIEKGLIKSAEVSSKKGIQVKIYSLTKTFDTLRNFVEEVSKEKIEHGTLTIFMRLGLYIALNAFKKHPETWYINVLFGFALVLDLIDERAINLEFRKIIDQDVAKIELDVKEELEEFLEMFSKIFT